MSESYVRVPPDSTGKRLRAILRTILGVDVYDEVIELAYGGTLIDPRDVSDRAARLLGIIYGDVGQLAQRAATRDLYTQIRHAGAEIDPRQIRSLTSADSVRAMGNQGVLTQSVITLGLLVELQTLVGAPYRADDTLDRWARQLGQVDLARVLGAALSHANPVISRITDGAAYIDPREFRPPATLYCGTRSTMAGTPVTLSAISVPIQNSVLVQADPDNTGRVLIGTVIGQPIELIAGDYIVVPIDNVQKIYMDVTVNLEQAKWLAS